MLAILGLLHRQFARNPFQRDIRLHLAQSLQRDGREFVIAGHPGRRRQHAMRTDEVAALPQRLRASWIASS